MNPRRAVTACIAAIRAARGVQRPAGAAEAPTAPAGNPQHFAIPVRPEYRTTAAGSCLLSVRRAAPPLFLAATALTLGFATPAHAQSYDWAPMALVSETMGIQPNRLCVGEATRGDIGCPTWAPTATTAGLEVSGTLSATRFVGDGSGLTGIAANVSVTTGASGSLIFRDGYGSLMASSGLSISSTTGSVGIGAGAPSWIGTNGLYAVGGIATSSSLYLSSGQFVYWGNASTKINGVAGSANDFMAFATSGTEQMRIVSTGYVGMGTSSPYANLHIVRSGTVISPTSGLGQSLIMQNTGSASAGTGISILSGNAGLSRIYFGDTDNDFIGALSYAHTDDSMRFTVSATEAVRIVSSGYVGIGTTSPNAFLHVKGAGTTPSLLLERSAVGSAVFQLGGAPSALSMGWANAAGGFVGGLTIASNSYALGVNLSSPYAPSQTLHVNGSALTTSWTGINFSSASRVTPTAPLEVSGTISATALLINGQSVTGGVSTFASLTDVSYSSVGYNVFGPGSLTGANAGVTETTAFGYNALKSNSNIGYANSAFGASALQNNTTGVFNTAVGRTALRGTSSGNYNTAVGVGSLISNTTGSSNAAFGINTLNNNPTGNSNAAFGAFAGQLLASGNSNLLLGFNAGGGMTSGGSNTVIGASVSPYSNTGNNQLAIANAIWGDTGNGDTLRAKIGINVTSPTASLEVSGTVSATALMVNGVAVTGGAGTFAMLTDVSYSSAGGNVFGPGSLSGAVSGVTTSTAYGYYALRSPSNTGIANTAIGTYTLQNNTSGSYNNALGRGALTQNTTGRFNTAVGTNSLNSLTGSDSNAALGDYAGTALTAGYYNTFIGTSAGQSLTSGGSNTLIGYNAGGGITSGAGNIVIGASLSPYSSTGSNQLNLGNALWGDVGNGDTLRAKLGINVTSPTASLEVSGTVSATAGSMASLSINGAATNATYPLAVGGSVGGSGFRVWSSSPGTASVPAFTLNLSSPGGMFFPMVSQTAFSASGTEVMRMMLSSGMGRVGINMVSPNAALEVSGTVSATRFVGDGSGLTGVTAAANDNITSGTAYVKALQNVGAAISGSLAIAGPVSATGDVKGNTLQLVDAPADTCSTANAGAIKRANGRFYYCRP